MKNTSSWLRLVSIVAALGLAAHTAVFAQDFPTPGKPIRIITPLATGGSSDLQARAIGVKLSQELGVPVVVENKPGASTAIAVRDLMRSAPDGHTLLFTITTTTSQLPHLYEKPPFDVFKDMTPVGVVARTRTILVANKNAPFNTVAELVAYAKAQPGKLSYGSYGIGSSGHIAGEMLKQIADLNIVHVPYKGGAEATRDLLGGQIQFVFDGPATAIANGKAGVVKILAVPDKDRLPAIPDVPTLTEAGIPGLDLPGLEQFFAPAGTPPAVIEKLNAAIMKVVRTPEVADMLVRGGSTLVASTPQEHARMMRDDHARWGKVIKQLGIKIE